MKIVHLNWALNIGGTESMIVDLVNEQSKKNDTHLVIINNAITQSLLEKINKRVFIHRLNRTPGSKNIFKLIYLNLILIYLKPDVIHCHTHDLVQTFFIKKMFGLKTCLTVHSTGNPESNFDKYNQMFAISKSVKKDINKRCSVDVKTVYNGINVALARPKIDFTYTDFKIVQVGRLFTELKGQHILLKALHILFKKLKVKNISIDFIGEGESKEHLEYLAEKLGIRKYCHFLGVESRKYIFENLASYDLFVQPSLYEGFGLTIAEAMAAKVPVLISNVEGPMEIINNGKYGYFFETEDSTSCADAIMLIMQNYGTKKFMTKINQGQKYIYHKFNIINTANEYVNYYSTL